MLFLLRKIRRKLIKENKITTYLLYAIGEIVLVVLGILIAVSIDNWNSDRKTLESATVHLRTLKLDLEKDLIQLTDLKEKAKRNVDFADKLLDQFKTITPIDSNTSRYLATLILEYNFSPRTIGIKALENANELPALSDSLQSAIRYYYAAVDEIEARDYISNTFIREKYEPQIFKRPDVYNRANSWSVIQQFYLDDPREVVPIKADQFLSDKSLENVVLARWYQSQTQIEAYAKGINALNEVLLIID